MHYLDDPLVHPPPASATLPGLAAWQVAHARRLQRWAIVNALDANGRALHEANPIRYRRWRGRMYSSERE